MTQTPFDAFSKEFLADLLAPFGTVERSFEVPGESKYIDLLFHPTEIVNSKEKGLLNPGLFHSKFRHFVHLRERAVPGIRDFRLRWLKPPKLVT